MKKFCTVDPAVWNCPFLPVRASLRPKLHVNIRPDMSLPVVADARPNVSVYARYGLFVRASIDIAFQILGWCSGGIRLLAMQETGGQLLAKNEGSIAPRLASIGGGCA